MIKINIEYDSLWQIELDEYIEFNSQIYSM